MLESLNAGEAYLDVGCGGGIFVTEIASKKKVVAIRFRLCVIMMHVA